MRPGPTNLGEICKMTYRAIENPDYHIHSFPPNQLLCHQNTRSMTSQRQHANKGELVCAMHPQRRQPLKGSSYSCDRGIDLWHRK